MPKRKHLIIGCGSAGLTALEQIRRLNSEDEIKVVTMEDCPPYSPTLLPYLLLGKIDEANLWIRAEGYFEEMQATFVKHKEVIRLLPDRKEVVYADGNREIYDTLLIAFGSEPVRPPIKGLEESDFLGFHTLADCKKLIRELEGKTKVAVLGAGLVGMELAISLLQRGHLVTLVEREPRILPLYFDEEAASLIKGVLLSHGVSILTGEEVSEVRKNKGKVEIGLTKGSSIDADILIASVGVKARTSFLKDAGIAINRGVLVDSHMRTNAEDVYAAGDVAEAPDFFAAQRGMNATILNAVGQGRVAGANMVGEKAQHRGWISANVFNFHELTAFSAGPCMPKGDQYEVISGSNNQSLDLKKLVYEGDNLVGAIFVNVDVDPGVILYLIENRVDIGPHKTVLFEEPREVSRWLMLDNEKKGARLIEA